MAESAAIRLRVYQRIECFMFWRDAVVPEANVLHVYNHDRHFAELYREKYAPLDPVFPAAVLLEVGRVPT
jgi:hypothetical protein